MQHVVADPSSNKQGTTPSSTSWQIQDIPSLMTLLSALSNVALSKAHEAYIQGVEHLQAGRLEAAILTLQESVFFSPENVNPLVALAECFIYLCDLQSAVRLYRTVQWILQRGVREAEREACRNARERDFNPALLLFTTDPKLAATDKTGILGIPPGVCATEPSLTLGGVSITIPDPTRKDKPCGASDFENDSGVHEEAVLIRLAGILDALGLAHYRFSNFHQALRFADAALDTLAEYEALHTRREGQVSSPRGNSSTSASRKTNGFVDPTVSLHRCVYLIALRREEDAELQLEAHAQQYPEFQVQSAALLIKVYCDRQAFRPARLLLEKHGSVLRHEPSLIIAQHTFYERYSRYRLKALADRDIGTISKCIEVYSSDVELLFARATILIDLDQHKKSVKDLFRCIKETNGSHRQAVEQMTQVLFKIGSSMDGESGIQEAITYYTESLKWRSDNTLVILARADCYLKIEDYENALMDYRRILQIDPDHKEATQRIAFLHDLWGRKLYQLGNVKAAEVEFTNAIKTDDKVALFYYHRALCRFELNETRYGLRDVLSCQQLNPAEPPLRAFIIRYLGSDEVPDTTKDSTKVIEAKQLVQHDVYGRRRLNLAANRQLPRQYPVAAKRAAAIYGQPSARITKVLQEAQDSVEAESGEPFQGHPSKEELLRGVPPHTSYVAYMEHQRAGEHQVLRDLSGSKCKLQSRAKK